METWIQPTTIEEYRGFRITAYGDKAKWFVAYQIEDQFQAQPVAGNLELLKEIIDFMHDSGDEGRRRSYQDWREVIRGKFPSDGAVTP
jgi:hypothetical protein